ncbi:MAG: 30S ribosomal protein S6 [Bacilli bacterium]|nr:30S ribosomal protein S6 [Bacilli bacterium]
MNKYEMMFIVKSQTEEADVKKVADSIEKVAKDNGAKVSEFKELGLKKLAYPIKKEINGYYYLLTFEAPKEAIEELNRKTSINENVIRHLIVRKEEE